MIAGVMGRSRAVGWLVHSMVRTVAYALTGLAMVALKPMANNRPLGAKSGAWSR